MYDDTRVENALAFIEATQQIEYEQAYLHELEQEVQPQLERIYEQDPSVDFEAFAPYLEQQAAAAGAYDASRLPGMFDAAYADYRSNHAAHSEPPAPATIAEAADSMMAEFKSRR